MGMMDVGNGHGPVSFGTSHPPLPVHLPIDKTAFLEIMRLQATTERSSRWKSAREEGKDLVQALSEEHGEIRS